MKRLITFITAAFIGYSIGYAQEVTDAADKVNLYNTQVKVFHSQIIDDDFYLYISLPDDYDRSDKKYPVLYLLDGDVAFGMAASIARYLQFGNVIPDLIIVGIGYGALKKNEGNSFGESLEEIITRVIAKYDFPVAFNFPAGHIDDNRALIFGSYIDLKVTAKKTKITFK